MAEINNTRIADNINLHELLEYHSDTGIFYWKNGTHRRAGCDRGDGYIVIKIKRKKFYAHRLAWYFYYGEMPDDQIDHINRNNSDNRIVNLRKGGKQLNARNTKLHKHNTSGVNGVYWSKGRDKWVAQIKVSQKTIYLGLFTDFDAAVRARRRANRKYGFSENHGENIKVS